jgi:hypothetical protein
LRGDTHEEPDKDSQIMTQRTSPTVWEFKSANDADHAEAFGDFP